MARTNKKDNEITVEKVEVVENEKNSVEQIRLVALENIKSGTTFYIPGDIFDSEEQEANYLIEVGAAAYTDKE